MISSGLIFVQKAFMVGLLLFFLIYFVIFFFFFLQGGRVFLEGFIIGRNFEFENELDFTIKTP